MEYKVREEKAKEEKTNPQKTANHPLYYLLIPLALITISSELIAIVKETSNPKPKLLDNIKFRLLEKYEISEKIKEIKSLKINNEQYTIFRLKSGGSYVIKGNGQFNIAGDLYDINMNGQELIIVNSNGEKFVLGGD